MMENTFLSVQNISFAYPNGSDVLKSVSMEIEKGSIFSLLGPNGSGKSTLLGCMFGFLHPYSGRVMVEDRDVSTMTQKEVARKMAYVAQHTRCVYSYKVRDYIAMGRTPYLGIFTKPNADDYILVDEAMELMGIPFLSDKVCTELSGGEKQMVDICRAIVQKPELIFLDEPTSALDFGNQIRTMRMIRTLHEQGYTVVMTTHNPDQCFMLGGRVGLLSKGGKMQFGSPDDVLTAENLSKVYGADIHVDYLSGINRKVCAAGEI